MNECYDFMFTGSEFGNNPEYKSYGGSYKSLILSSCDGNIMSANNKNVCIIIQDGEVQLPQSLSVKKSSGQNEEDINDDINDEEEIKYKYLN